MLGNPCQANWPTGLPEYVIASLPQLELLDGKEIHKSDRIKALQVFSERQRYVREQAVRICAEKAAKSKQQEIEDAEKQRQAEAKDEAVIDVVSGEATDISHTQDTPSRASPPEKKSVMASEEKVPYTPEMRREMYMEMAEQKEEQEARRRDNMPKERNTESEHEEALRQAREQEERDDGSIRQCNEGKWEFRLLDEILDVVLEVDLPRFLDTSLVDVDVHPSFVSIVAKNKVFRLRFPELVHSDKGKAERSKVTGTLRLTLPKAHITPTQRLRAQLYQEEREKELEAKKKRLKGGGARLSTRDAQIESNRTKKLRNQQAKIADEVRALNSAARHILFLTLTNVYGSSTKPQPTRAA
jgi:protein TilB